MAVEQVVQVVNDKIVEVGDKMVEVGEGVNISVSSLQNTAANAAKQMMEYVQGTQDFVAEQAPLLCQEIIRYGIFENVLGIAVVTTIFVTLWKLGGKGIRYCHDDLEKYQNLKKEKHSSEGREAIYAFSCIGRYGSLILTIPLFIYAGNLGQAIIAPRLYLLEYLAHLIKSVS